MYAKADDHIHYLPAQGYPRASTAHKYKILASKAGRPEFDPQAFPAHSPNLLGEFQNRTQNTKINSSGGTTTETVLLLPHRHSCPCAQSPSLAHAGANSRRWEQVLGSIFGDTKLVGDCRRPGTHRKLTLNMKRSWQYKCQSSLFVALPAPFSMLSGHGGAHLQSQHVGGLGKRVSSRLELHSKTLP